MTLENFIAKHNLKLTAREIPTRPDGLMGDSGFHFRCQLTKGNKGFGFYWSQGSGIGAEMSTLPDVLDTLASGASTYENAKSAVQCNHEKNQGHLLDAFDEWASYLGYESDSRKAEKIFKATKRQAEQLKRLLGEPAYNQLIWNVNR